MCLDSLPPGTKKQGPLPRVPASTTIYATILNPVILSESNSPSADPVKGTRADKGELCDSVTIYC